VAVTVSGLDGAAYRASLARVDEHHSNVVAQCPADVTWPDETLWKKLHAADGLHTERLADVSPDQGMATFDLELPMPGVARIRLSPCQR
jgi:hypothetical protein